MLIGFRAQTVSWRLCALADDTRHVVCSQCHPHVCVVCKSRLHPKLTAAHSYEMLFYRNKKITTCFRDCEAYSLLLVVLLQMLLLFVFLFVSIHFSSLAPPTPSKVTCACCSAFSHHVFSEARWGSPAVQDRQWEALRVRGGHPGMSYYGLSGMTKNTFGRWQVSPSDSFLPGVWNRCKRRW